MPLLIIQLHTVHSDPESHSEGQATIVSIRLFYNPPQDQAVTKSLLGKVWSSVDEKVEPISGEW